MSEQNDGRRSLSAKLEEYLNATDILPVEEKITETDTLISACNDTSIRRAVAELVFEHYRRSRLMGDEAVAVHIADRWALGGEAADFARINRQSLIGMKAPSLEPVVPGFGGGRKTVLYFYDTDCSTCRKLTAGLVSFLGSMGGKQSVDTNDADPVGSTCGTIEFVAFYVGSDKDGWSRYIADNFPQDFPARHYMDAERLSDFAVKYGVDGTPRLFLIDENGVVQGRRLDVDALRILIDSSEPSTADAASATAYQGEGTATAGRYGRPEAMEFFDKLFSSYGDALDASDVDFVSGYIASGYSGAASDAEKSEYKQMFADLLYYLASRQEEVFRESCFSLIKNHILNDDVAAGGMWTTEEDSLYVLSYASLLYDLLSRACIGTHVPSIKLSGKLYRLDSCMKARWKDGRNVNLRLDRIGGGRNIIVFYSPGCGDCSGQIAKINAIVSAAGQEKVEEDIRFFLVNVGELEKKSPRAFRKAADSLDLSTLPYLVETDSRGIVVRRYFKF